jgi:hypothetical protein
MARESDDFSGLLSQQLNTERNRSRFFVGITPPLCHFPGKPGQFASAIGIGKTPDHWVESTDTGAGIDFRQK